MARRRQSFAQSSMVMCCVGKRLIQREKKSLLLVFFGFLVGQFFGRHGATPPCSSIGSSGRTFSTFRERMTVQQQQQESGASIATTTDSTTTTTTSTTTTASEKTITTAGWNSVDVFYGSTDSMDRQFPRNRAGQHRWFSQVKQDVIVAALFRNKKSGFFIDLAANDAVEISNTFALERFYGWTGLCIEPNPKYWRGLAYRSCQTVGAVIGANRLEEVQFNFEGVYGGIVGEQFDNTGVRSQGASAYTVPLAEIFARYNVPKDIDYLSLDVEGAEELVMKAFPFDKYRIKVITGERLHENVQSLLRSNGYVFIDRLAVFGESLWVHNSVKGDLDLDAVDRLKLRPLEFVWNLIRSPPRYS